jgi:hypothetical protein
MTEYTDINQVNALIMEQANIDQALSILDEQDGTVANVVIAAQPAGASVMCMMVDAPQAMISGVRAGLIQRFNTINQELRDLGVTGTPPDHQGGGPPLVEALPA